MKILLCCAAGMSTSLLVENMKKVAKERGFAAEIVAVAVHEFDEYIDQFDVVLLGPQIRYKLPSFKQAAAEKGKPCDVIDAAAYGMVNGAKVLDQAVSLRT